MIHLTLQQLSAYLDGELPDASTELVRRHLSQCEECTGRFARIEEQEEVLTRLLNHDPGEAFFEKFADTIAFEEEAPGAKRGGVRGAKGARGAKAAPAAKAAPGTKGTAATKGTAGKEPFVERRAPEEPVPTFEENEEWGSMGDEATEAPPERPAPPPAPVEAIPIDTPVLYGRRAEDRVVRPLPPSRVAARSAETGRSTGWIIAVALVVMAASVGVMVLRNRATPRLSPAGEQPPAPTSRLETSEETGSSTSGSREEVSPAGDGGSSTGARRPTPEELLEESAQPPPPASSKPPAAKQPAKAHALAAPAPERLVDRPPQNVVPVRTIVTTTTLEPEASGSPAGGTSAPTTDAKTGSAMITASTPPAGLETARQASLVAAREKTAASFDAAALAWERVLPQLGDFPEDEALGRREFAQARFQAWSVEPTEPRREAAISAARAYLLYAPPGPDRDQAWTWLSRLKH